MQYAGKLGRSADATKPGVAMRRLLVIIESPYAANKQRSIAEHVVYAQQCLRDSLDRGEAPFASHLLYPGALDDAILNDRLLGIHAGYEWGARADLIAFYTDYGWSGGMLLAQEHYEKIRRPIEFRRIQV